MSREQKIARKKALEKLIGEFDYDDPDYDDKRAFILFGAQDPNATWQSIIGKALTPEMAAKMEEEAESRQEGTAWAIWHAYNAE